MKNILVAFMIAASAFAANSLAQEPIVSRIYVPEKWVKIIKAHLEQIEQKGWGKVEPGDLYHAHVVLVKQDKRESFKDLEEFFHNSGMILYHSDEHTFRWRGTEGDWPVEKRTPRSIVGYWDSKVAAASTLVTNPQRKIPNYLPAGSITMDDIAREHPDEFALRRCWIIRLPAGQCEVNLNIDISPVIARPERGNLKLGERNFAVTMECGERCG